MACVVDTLLYSSVHLDIQLHTVTIMLQPARLAVDYSCCSLYSDADKLLA